MSTDKKEWKDFSKEIILIFVGALIGFLAGYLNDVRKNNYNKQTTLIIVRSYANKEVELGKQLILCFSKEVNEPSDTLFLTDAIRWYHDPTLYLAVSNNIGLFEPDIVNSYLAFYNSIKQCQQFRDIAISKYNEDPKKSKLGSPFQVYIIGLNSLVKNGSKLIEQIDHYYPSLLNK